MTFSLPSIKSVSILPYVEQPTKPFRTKVLLNRIKIKVMSKSKILWWLILFFGQKNNVSIAKELHKLIKSLEPYGIVIITDNPINKKPFLENLISFNPAVIIDLNEFVNHTNDVRSFELSVFQNPRQSSVFVIISRSSAEILDILGDIVKMEPVKARPKTLLIILSNCSDEDLKNIFTKAWSLKFLDLTITSNDDVLTYNPFTNEYRKENLKDMEELFPDKLNNVNEYPLMSRAFNAPPFLIAKVQNNKVVKVTGTKIVRLNILAEKMNFQLKFKKDLRNLNEAYKKLQDNLESNEINVSPMGIHLDKRFLKRDILVGYPLSFSKITAVVPIIKNPRINLTLNMFLLLLVFCVILMILFTFIYALKLNLNYWNIFYIFGILIGTTIMEPQKTVSRIVYLTIAILSIIFSNDFLSILADVKLHFVEQKLNSFEDICRMKIPIYVVHHYHILNDTESDRKLLTYSQKIEKFSECVKMLIETNNASCISASQMAEHHAKTNLDNKGQPVMRVADISLDYQFDVYFYEKASPFMEKIEKIFRRIHESGLVTVHENRIKNKVQIVKPKVMLNEETLLTQTLLIILSVGYTLGVFIFVGEFVCFNGFTNTLIFISSLIQVFASIE